MRTKVLVIPKDKTLLSLGEELCESVGDGVLKFGVLTNTHITPLIWIYADKRHIHKNKSSQYLSAVNTVEQLSKQSDVAAVIFRLYPDKLI